MKWKVSFSILLRSEKHHAIIILFNRRVLLKSQISVPSSKLKVNAGSFQLLLCHKSDSQSTSTSSSVFLSPSISRSSRQTLSNRHSGGREGGPRRLQPRRPRPVRPCGLRRDVKKVSLITAANNGRRKERRMEEGANINTFFPRATAHEEDLLFCTRKWRWQNFSSCF